MSMVASKYSDLYCNVWIMVSDDLSSVSVLFWSCAVKERKAISEQEMKYENPKRINATENAIIAPVVSG